jgi:hypothetical protein
VMIRRQTDFDLKPWRSPHPTRLVHWTTRARQQGKPPAVGGCRRCYLLHVLALNSTRRLRTGPECNTAGAARGGEHSTRARCAGPGNHVLTTRKACRGFR